MKQLEIIRKIQDQYENVAVGGSIGLLLNGIVLERDWDKVDIDMTSDKPLNIDGGIVRDCCNASADMELKFELEGIDIDIQVDADHKSIQVMHEGHLYRVSTVPHILSWKYKYEGTKKHKGDIVLIESLFKSRKITTYDKVF